METDCPSLEEIKTCLVRSCISGKSKEFLPYLLEPSVEVNFPNKIRFYKFFKEILTDAAESSTGVLELRKERELLGQEEGVLAYNFYDEVHRYPRINLKVKEQDGRLSLGLFPF